MNGTARSPEMQKIQAMAAELAEQGYEVIIEPTAERLPFPLGNYRPDLIAFKDDGGVVLEVRQSQHRLSVDRFQDIAEQIAAHKGWKFLLVTLDDVTDAGRPEGLDDLPSWGELETKLGEVEQLSSDGYGDPALLYVWSAMEGALRRQAIAQHLPIERFSPKALIDHMYSSGELSMEEFDVLKAIHVKRNRMAHGVATKLGDRELNELLVLTRSLIARWGKPSSLG